MPLRPDPELEGILDRSTVSPSVAVLAGIIGRRNHRAQRRLKLVSVASVAVALAAVGVAASVLASSTPSSGPVGEAARPLAGSVRSSPASGFGAARHEAAAVPATQPRRNPAPPANMRWATVTSEGAGTAFASANAGSASAAVVPCPDSDCAPSADNAQLVPLFRRSAGGAAIRAYLQQGLTGVAEPLSDLAAPSDTGHALVVPSVCTLASALVVEVSDAGAVAKLSILQPALGAREAGASFEVIDTSIVGAAEKDPVEVVSARVDPDVAGVSARFGDGTVDHMVPRNGWVVLADHGASLRSGGGTTTTVELVATSADGSELASASLPASAAVALPTGCFLPGAPEAGNTSNGSSSHG